MSDYIKVPFFSYNFIPFQKFIVFVTQKYLLSNFKINCFSTLKPLLKPILGILITKMTYQRNLPERRYFYATKKLHKSTFFCTANQQNTVFVT